MTDNTVKTFVVTETGSGHRLDHYLSSVGELSRSGYEKLIAQNRVFIGGGAARKNHRVAVGERIDVLVPPPAPCGAYAEDIELNVVFEDADIIVVNKQRGLVVHPSPGHGGGTLVNALLHHCGGTLSGIGGVERPGIVHRLDKDTSGLLVCAKNDVSHVALCGDLQKRLIHRVYLCVCRGTPSANGFTIDAPLGRSGVDRKKRAVVPVSAGGKRAVTHIDVLTRWAKHSLLRCTLETGRTHQIRVHLAHRGLPLTGDSVYGAGRELGLEGQCLHAVSLRFAHPRTGEAMCFEAPLPPYFVNVIDKLGAPLWTTDETAAAKDAKDE